MKYTTLLAILLASNAINSEDQQKNVVVYVSSNNVNRSSNTIDGHATEPMRFQIIPHYYQPEPCAPQTQHLHQPNQSYHEFTSSGPTASLEPISTFESKSPSGSIPTSTSSWQIPSLSQLMTTLKNTACSINPVTITAGALVALYGAYLIKLHNLSFTVMKKNTWATWKEHIPLEVMLEIPPLEVAEELFNAIKTKYLPLNSADLMTPIVKFNNAVDHELTQLNQFIRLHEWLSYTKLAYIFPKQEIEIARAHVKIKRLLFLKDVLLTWMSDYSSAIMHDKFIPRYVQQPVQHAAIESNQIDEINDEINKVECH